MSGALPDGDARAAEYVLGTATAAEAAATERDMAADPALAEAVAAWERRLAPLAALALPEAPPSGLWERIEAALSPAPAAPSPPWRDRLLRWWAGGATAAALALGAYALLLSRPPAPPLTAAMVADRTQAAWSVVAGPDGALRLVAAAPVSGPEPGVPPGQVMQLWALPPGATAPTSLALLEPGQRRVTLSAPAVRPVAGMLVEITAEPPGGSPTGRPTGPVLFIGRLSQPGPDS